MDNDLTIHQAREAAAHPPGPRPPARAAGAVPRVILGDWLCWVLSGMWGGREWWDPPAAAARVRGEGSAEMRPGARKAAGGDGYPSRMNWVGWGALWGARGTIAGLFRGLRCRLTRIRTCGGGRDFLGPSPPPPSARARPFRGETHPSISQVQGPFRIGISLA